MEWIAIGNAPSAETIPTTPPDQDSPAREIAEIFARQLIRHFGPPPTGAEITIERMRDRISTMHCAVCRYDPVNDTAFEYAWRCSEDAPARWDDVAAAEFAQLSLEPEN